MDGSAAVLRGHENSAQVETMTGNLLYTEDCGLLAKRAAVVFHLAAGRGEKSFPDASPTGRTTRNLLDACYAEGNLRRFVKMSSSRSIETGNPKSRSLDGLLQSRNIRNDVATPTALPRQSRTNS